MRKRSKLFILLGVFLIIIPFLFNIYNSLRLISILIGIIFITLSFVVMDNKNIFFIMLTPITLFCLTYGMDSLLFYLDKRIPIYAIQIDSNDYLRTYNSIFYRIYDCNNDLILDYGYEKNYACSSDLLDSLDVNTILSTPLQTFEKYQGKFIKVKGKISVISGMDTIELSSYTKKDDSVNGYVNFNLNNNLVVHVNEDLSEYRIYDNIEVIGRVDTWKEDNGKHNINLVDVKLIPSDLYKRYSYIIKTNNSKTLMPLLPNQNYYLYGISSINIKYDEDNIYELGYLLSDTRFSWDNLIDNSPKEEIKDKDGNVALKYVMDKFNLLECNNGNKIIANKNIKLNAKICLIEEQN